MEGAWRPGSQNSTGKEDTSVETRRLFLAMLLSLVVVIGWQYLVEPPQPPREGGVEGLEAGPSPAREGGEEERGQGRQEGRSEPGAAAGDEGEVGEAAEGAREEGRPPVSGEAEEEIVLETGRVRARFSNLGAQLLSFELKEHRAADGDPVDLVRARKHGPYPFGLTVGDGGEHPLNRVLFSTEAIEDGRGVRFVYSGPEGWAEKIFRLEGAPGAEIRDLLGVSVSVGEGEDWGVVLGPGLRNTTIEEREGDYFERRRGIYNLGGEIERLPAEDTEEVTSVPGTNLVWAGLDDNYFLTVLLFNPREQGIREVVFQPVLLVPGGVGQPVGFEPLPPEDLRTEEEQGWPRELLMVVRARGGRLEATSYWGSKQLERLSELAVPGTGGEVSASLDHTIELGIFRILAVPLLWGLHWIYENLVSNYGWAIVLMTLLLKLLLLPLTHRSYASMRKMQELQPKMEALRAKYRPKLKDKQGRPNMEAQRKMNEEMMALFKEEGVNPAGGCLPMLLQMPFFFAFYYILREAVELRNASWLWVADLSTAEPTTIHWLPLVMAVTQFLQQRMTPMAGDQMQRKLFQLLPFFFLVLFWGMPSGLVLYWLTNNVLTIAQQSTYNHLRKRNDSTADTKSTKKDGGKKSQRK